MRYDKLYGDFKSGPVSSHFNDRGLKARSHRRRCIRAARVIGTTEVRFIFINRTSTFTRPPYGLTQLPLSPHGALFPAVP